MVMIAGYGQHRYPDRPNGPTHRRYGFVVGAAGIKEVPGNQHELRTLFARKNADTFNCRDPLLPQKRSGGVRHSGERLSDLPIGGV
jgi:hypothetical protein